MDDLMKVKWVKSSYSTSSGGECLELAVLHGDGVAIRDSKRSNGPVLRVPATAWAAFRTSLKADELNV
ncbi:DUF397 domain-containing protein [Sphaerisporangium album]|uniref:DUF397 domain-containing protein n=1 Tax=Sphaerisporangium album TaxID=509200 RepID=A0A367FQD8_9ACTN|nr:DUF397 domain-containing protein [Sphaerisporangium album]RCG32603.1 DUF397 domain-containing protein [Sphaerisporangium album]